MTEAAWISVLMLGGLFFLVAEVALPTGGALGGLAMVCLLAALYRGFSNSLTVGYACLAAEVILIPGTYLGSLGLIARLGWGDRVILRPPLAEEFPVSTDRLDLGRLVGLRGKALTPLRPSGMVGFEGRRLDGVSEGELIPIGADVLAVRVWLGRLVVRAESAATADPAG